MFHRDVNFLSPYLVLDQGKTMAEVKAVVEVVVKVKVGRRKQRKTRRGKSGGRSRRMRRHFQPVYHRIRISAQQFTYTIGIQKRKKSFKRCPHFTSRKPSTTRSCSLKIGCTDNLETRVSGDTVRRGCRWSPTHTHTRRHRRQTATCVRMREFKMRAIKVTGACA